MIRPRLVPGIAAAALMVTPDRRYLMQLRDDKPDIFFPNFWGNFGGALDAGELPADALLREIREELGWGVRAYSEFCVLDLDFRFANLGMIRRHYFVVPIEEVDLKFMHLGEGQCFSLFYGGDIVRMPQVVPYDNTAIWLHHEQLRFSDGL